MVDYVGSRWCSDRPCRELAFLGYDMLGLVVAVVIGFGFAAGILGVTDGSIPILTFVKIAGLFLLCTFSFWGGIFGRSHNRDRDINGEIEGRLQMYTDQKVRLICQLRNGMPVEDKLDEIEQAEKSFRATIEYGVVTDGSENYYSYKRKS